jgi:threonine dehydratase
MSFSILQPGVIEEAYKRIQSHVRNTNLVESKELNQELHHDIFFKLETEQKVGSFKVRGVLNTLLSLQEQNKLPHEVVAFSSGNHGQAVAWAANALNIRSTVFLPQNTSLNKQHATSNYGAHVVMTKTRQEAEDLVKEKELQGCYAIPPSDHDLVIAGNGTACYEALREMDAPDAIFASCGGGGLVSGCFLATQLLAPAVKVFAVEPENANDVARSIKQNKIFRFIDSPPSVADGARTLGVSERIFYYLKQTAGVIEVKEEDIIFWTKKLREMLKVNCEPTAALAMAGAFNWLKQQKVRKKILVILSGSNTDGIY